MKYLYVANFISTNGIEVELSCDLGFGLSHARMFWLRGLRTNDGWSVLAKHAQSFTERELGQAKRIAVAVKKPKGDEPWEASVWYVTADGHIRHLERELVRKGYTLGHPTIDPEISMLLRSAEGTFGK